MRLVVLQPGYLPWVGYFEQVAKSDLFVHYDDVQYDKHGWRNRNRIRTTSKEGWSWLTVPVLTSGKFGDQINVMEVDNRARSGEKHWRSLEQNYRKAPFFAQYAPAFKELYEREWKLLVDLDLALTGVLLKAFGLDAKKNVRSSEVKECPPGTDPTERLLSLCRHFGATEYYSGAAARAYLDVKRFDAIGTKVEYQDYAHPTYKQVHEPFISHLSAIDLLFNVGPGSLALLLSTSPAESKRD